MKAILTEVGKINGSGYRIKEEGIKGMHFVPPKQFKENVYLNFQIIYIHLPPCITFLFPFRFKVFLLNSWCVYPLEFHSWKNLFRCRESKLFLYIFINRSLLQFTITCTLMFSNNFSFFNHSPASNTSKIRFSQIEYLFCMPN